VTEGVLSRFRGIGRELRSPLKQIEADASF
jgi:hypothetical protein